MRKLLTAALAGLTLVGGVAATTSASADDRRGYRGHQGYYNNGHRGYSNRGYYNPGYGNYYRRDRGGDQAVAAIAGGLLGYALGAATSQPRYYAPPPRYYAPAPTYYAPRYYAPPVYYAPRPYYGYSRPCYNGYC
jgi:hypothetical protein